MASVSFRTGARYKHRHLNKSSFTKIPNDITYEYVAPRDRTSEWQEYQRESTERVKEYDRHSVHGGTRKYTAQQCRARHQIRNGVQSPNKMSWKHLAQVPSEVASLVILASDQRKEVDTRCKHHAAAVKSISHAACSIWVSQIIRPACCPTMFR
jgi:hypothetical protein